MSRQKNRFDLRHRHIVRRLVTINKRLVAVGREPVATITAWERIKRQVQFAERGGRTMEAPR